LIGDGTRQGTTVSASLVGTEFPLNEFARTRCAGPGVTDIAGALTTRLITERALLRGRGNVIDLSGERPFSSGGFSGTVHSTVKMKIRGAQDLLRESQPPEGPTHPLRLRELEVDYRLERLSGQVVTDVSGLADPDLCGPLDACGLGGSLTITPRAAGGEGYVLAIGRLRRNTAADLRRAVGLAPGKPPRGVSVFGYVEWDPGAGHVATDLRRDGADPCTDTQTMTGGVIEMGFRGSTVHAHFGSPDTVPGADILRTRCPGPGIGDVASSGRLAGGSLPRRAFARRDVTLHLTRGGPFSASGYHGTTHADVTAVLHRTRISPRVQVIQIPDDFGGVFFRIGR
jgi:hypothetical protein